MGRESPTSKGYDVEKRLSPGPSSLLRRKALSGGGDRSEKASTDVQNCPKDR